MKKLITLSLLSFTLVLFSGCGIDSDGDGQPDINDLCPLDPNKTNPGECGCGIAEGTCNNDNDSDNDGTPDQDDQCPLDPNKIKPGVCGCDVSDKDSDGDKTADCNDNCPNDPNKLQPGECGCGVAEGTCSTDPTITASDENPDKGEGKEMAFDKNVNTKWLAFSNAAWIQVEFGGGVAKAIQAYTITSANDYPERDPKDWTLLASNDGSTWDTLDTRSCVSFSDRFEKRSYVINNTTPYKMVKLDITSNKYSSANITQTAEIEFLESSNGIDDDGCEDDTCCSGQGDPIKYIGTTSKWDSDGKNVPIDIPAGTQEGDLLILALHRTDDDLPLFVDGWTRAGECFKSGNGNDKCGTEATCQKWHSNKDFCEEFQHGSGHDLAQSIFYRTATANEPNTLHFDLDFDGSSHVGWIILTTLRNANTIDPVRDWAGESSDDSPDSKFPSVHGEAGDMLILSQSFDDFEPKSAFTAPDGMENWGYVGNSDETGYMFGVLLTSSGETGVRTTNGPGASSNKDGLVSLTIKPK